MVRNADRLRDIFGEEKSRDGGQSMMFYERRDGRGAILVSGTNSPTAVQMKSARIQVQDDLSLWEMLPSGDSEKQADGRYFPHHLNLDLSATIRIRMVRFMGEPGPPPTSRRR